MKFFLTTQEDCKEYRMTTISLPFEDEERIFIENGETAPCCTVDSAGNGMWMLFRHLMENVMDETTFKAQMDVSTDIISQEKYQWYKERILKNPNHNRAMNYYRLEV